MKLLNWLAVLTFFKTGTFPSQILSHIKSRWKLIETTRDSVCVDLERRKSARGRCSYVLHTSLRVQHKIPLPGSSRCRIPHLELENGSLLPPVAVSAWEWGWGAKGGTPREPPHAAPWSCLKLTGSHSLWQYDSVACRQLCVLLSGLNLETPPPVTPQSL